MAGNSSTALEAGRSNPSSSAIAVPNPDQHDFGHDTQVILSVVSASLPSRPIPENRESGVAKDARRVLGSRSGPARWQKKMSIVLLAALGPPLPAQFTVCVGVVRLHVGPTARAAAPNPPFQRGHPGGTCSGLLSPDIPPCQRPSRSSSPTSFFPASLPPRPGSLRCRETSSSPRSRDTIRTRCLPDSDALSLSAHVHRQHHHTLGTKTTAAMPCARHEDSVPLVAVAEEACRGNPLFRCFEFFGATLPFESNRTIAKSLHAALAAAGPCSPRLTLDGRMGMIPAGLNFQRPRPSANRVGDRPGTRTMALGMAATTVTTHTHGRLPPGRPFPVRPRREWPEEAISSACCPGHCHGLLLGVSAS